MLFRRPCIYDDFVCTADKCTDNCCIGWEICIDGDTAELYKSTEGDFGKRLRESITYEEYPSFILKGERCPFLNEKNLCDIITTLGESCLCQICRDHPRWFEWYGNEKEGGIGLSCREGARLILTDEGFADYYESECDDFPDEDFDDESYAFLLGVRERIFDILCDRKSDFINRAERILELSKKAEDALTGENSDVDLSFSFESEMEKAIELFEKTEAVNEIWTEEWKNIKADEIKAFAPTKEEEEYLIRLAAYFVWRYFLTSAFDYRPLEKIRFALFSVSVIYSIYCRQENKDFEALLSSAVLYSKQMEYSEENLDLFFSDCR